MEARESIPSHILLHPRSSHDVPEEHRVKLGAKEPSMEEAKRCELKLPVEIKRTARIHCGTRVPTGEIASRKPVKEEKVPTPVRRSARILGMKRKDSKEVSPKPKDYGGSDYSDDHSPSSWTAAGRDDNDLYYWEEVPKEKTPSLLEVLISSNDHVLVLIFYC
jgi:hypothetical protein